MGYYRAPLAERLMSRVVVDEGTGCWHWMGATDAKGHGQIGDRERRRPIWVNRASWEVHHGPIPEGHQVRSTCPKGPHPCVNPDHLYLYRIGDAVVNRKEKPERNPRVLHPTKMRCKHGHPLTDENLYYDTYIDPKGRERPRRQCKACTRRRAQSYRARQSR